MVRYLQGAFTRGVKNRLVLSNPFDGVDLPKVQPKKVQFFRRFEVEAMIGVAWSQWWRVFIRLAYTSGLRQEELLTLRWEDVDLDEQTVTVAPKKAGTFNANGREYPILEWTAKDYETRVVKIPTDTVAALRRYRDFQEQPRSAYVFLSLDRLADLEAYMAGHDGKHPARARREPELGISELRTGIDVAITPRQREAVLDV